MEQIGNWRLPRKTWSQKVRSYWVAAVDDYPKRIIPVDTTLEQPLIDYYQNDAYRALILAQTLFKDIYNLDIHPFSIVKMIKDNRVLLVIYGQKIANLLENYGNYAIIHSKTGCPNEKRIAPGFYLTKTHIGMPVKDFLIWYKGCKTLPNFISEWSGIPTEKIQTAYEALINAFREFLKLDSYEDKKIQAKIDRKASFVNINITVAGETK